MAKRKVSTTDRRAPQRQSYDKVLIVSEGEETEPNYFRDLIKLHDISSVNVRISGDCGTTPTCVVKYGMELAQGEAQSGEAFDRVYCVFDRDSYHLAKQKKAYQAALKLVDAQNQIKQVFYACNSVPSFEYWLLLHFCESSRQFAAQGNKSVADMVFKALKEHWPNYEKNLLTPYKDLKKIAPSGEELAIERAKRTLKQAIAVGDDNPSTKVHELVEYLLNIKSPKNSA